LSIRAEGFSSSDDVSWGAELQDSGNCGERLQSVVAGEDSDADDVGDELRRLRGRCVSASYGGKKRRGLIRDLMGILWVLMEFEGIQRKSRQNSREDWQNVEDFLKIVKDSLKIFKKNRQNSRLVRDFFKSLKSPDDFPSPISNFPITFPNLQSTGKLSHALLFPSIPSQLPLSQKQTLIRFA
jgi:hypothetical protein